MDELERAVGEAAGQIGPGWDGARVETALARLHRRRRRRVVTRAAAGVTVVAAVASVTWWVRPERMAPEAPAVAPAQQVIAFADGSRAILVDEETELVVHEAGASSVALELSRGAAELEVERDLDRRFRIEARSVSVEVIGTAFGVRIRGEAVGVAVHRGRVRVDAEAGSFDLVAGDHRWFAAPDSETERATEPTASSAPSAPAPELRPVLDTTAHAAPEVPGWRRLARVGQFERAYQQLNQDAALVRDEPADLLLAADVARLSGHPEDALEPLGRVVERHGSDPRAPVAAFTLGRVLLGQLDRPARAAVAFARARSLHPEGALAPDALAREVEAWSRADEPGRASERARLYLRLYPRGARADQVRRHGGLGR